MSERWRAIARQFRDPYDYGAPALRFEQASGLSGVHAPWRMPDGQSHAQVESQHFEDIVVLVKSAESWFRRLDQVAHRRVLALFDATLALNPGLKGLRQFREDPIQLTDVVMGITSQFNVPDIVHFLTVPFEEYNANPKIRQLTLENERRAGARLFWKPSWHTLGRISRALDRDPRYAQASGAPQQAA
jgi:hypothetical protein